MKTVYVKKYIKTVDDLPKEDGYYFVSHGDKYDINLDVFHFTKVNAKQNHLDWLDHVVFYLLPVELPDEKEIEEYATGLANPESVKDFSRGEWLGVKEGANYIINKLIKP